MDFSRDYFKRKNQRKLFSFKNIIRAGIVTAAFFSTTSVFAAGPENEEDTTTKPVVTVEESVSTETMEEATTLLPLLEVNVLSNGMTVEDYLKSYDTNSDMIIKDDNGNEVENTSIIETGMHVFLNGVEHLLQVNDPELKEVIPTNEINDDDITTQIEDTKNSTQDEQTLNPEEQFVIETIPIESDLNTPIEENQKKAEVQKTKAIQEEEGAQQKIGIEEEVETQIKDLIRAKANAQIESDREEQMKVFMKNVSTAQIKMDKKLKDWSSAKRQLVYVNKTAKAIKIINGKPNLDQVAITIGQYQAIANEFAAANRDRDLVNLVTVAVKILMDNKIEPDITVKFVKDTIDTSNNMKMLLNDLKIQHLVVFDLVEYQKELNQREKLLKEIESSSRLHLFKIASLHFRDGDDSQEVE
ncbi:MAG TPA: hypothetical protein VEV44_05530 [Pseudoneobacillus sp.]|nr:hypothetical protein [Pseudoneobacillus sp.]